MLISIWEIFCALFPILVVGLLNIIHYNLNRICSAYILKTVMVQQTYCWENLGRNQHVLRKVMLKVKNKESPTETDIISDFN